MSKKLEKYPNISAYCEIHYSPGHFIGEHTIELKNFAIVPVGLAPDDFNDWAMKETQGVAEVGTDYMNATVVVSPIKSRAYANNEGVPFAETEISYEVKVTNIPRRYYYTLAGVQFFPTAEFGSVVYERILCDLSPPLHGGAIYGAYSGVDKDGNYFVETFNGGSWSAETWYKHKLVLEPDYIKYYLDEVLVHTFTRREMV